jgi:hypothetical protein
MYDKNNGTNRTHITIGMPEILVVCSVVLLMSGVSVVGYTLLTFGLISSIAVYGQKIKRFDEESKAEQQRFESLRNTIIAATPTPSASNVTSIISDEDDTTDYH